MKTIATLLLLLITTVAWPQETVTIGTQTWMKNNLNVGTMIPAAQQQANNGVIEKWCYNNTELNCTLYGGWYQWNELMAYQTAAGSKGICPEGFHVPTVEEFYVLINYCGGSEQAGNALIARNAAFWKFYMWKPTNSTGFTALGNGYVVKGKSGLQKLIGTFWTSSWKPYADVEGYEQYASTPGTNPVYFIGNNWGPPFKPGLRYPEDGYGVRCIKDNPY